MTGPDGTETTLAEAREALARGDHAAALAALDRLPDVDADLPEALDLRGAAAYGAGLFDTAIAAWERLHDVHLAAGRTTDAAVAAAVVAMNLMCETGLMAPVRGWAARAHRLLGPDADPGPAQALLAVVAGYERFLSGDPDAARAPARLAFELGTAHDVGAARGLGRVLEARLAIQGGDVDRGIAMLDEIAVDLGAGEFDPLTTGNIYCELICVAQWVGRHDRAREWTELMERWRHGPAFGATHGRCRVHRAEMLRRSGTVTDAEQEALAACAELRPWMRREYGWPLVELGNIRLRGGDLDGAEEAFAEAHARAWSPQPGWALLRLEQGDPEAAADMVRSEIEHPMAVPWKERPPFGELRLVPLLAAQAEIAAAAGDPALALAAAEQLAVIAMHHPSDGLRAEAALARARADVTAGAHAEAVSSARAAVAAWADEDAPYDVAIARIVLGHALAGAGSPSLARTEWHAAATALEAFGALTKAAEAAGLVAVQPGSTSGGAAPTAAGPVAVLREDAGRWVLAHGGVEVGLPDLKGLRLLATLLAEPGREFPAVDLAGAGAVQPPLPVLDAEAAASYRRRLAEVEEDLAEAERDHDEARRELASRDREYLLAELAGGLGLGGRLRTTGGTAERARTSVTRSLRYALARIAEQLPDLGAHLDRAVRTGSCCSYQPDPVAPLTWHLR